jgi:hypothetical protein
VGCVIVAGLLLVSVVGLLIKDSIRGVTLERSIAIAEEIRGRLEIGMTREEVERHLDGHVKRRYHCDGSEYLEEVCFIGHRRANWGALLYLGYDKSEGTPVLIRATGMDPSLLHSYLSCEEYDR